MTATNGRSHAYHAEASVLEGHLHLPLEQQIKPQAYAKLPEKGGYLSQRSEKYRLESVISYHSAHTQVAGNRDVKPGHGWATLATTVIEGLNVLDVLTADRIVAQIMTEHPLVGYVPNISFLGTHFDNLRIAGRPVDLKLDLDILGDKPAEDAPYSLDAGLIDRVSKQYKAVTASPELPSEINAHYSKLSSTLGAPEGVECSLVNQAGGDYAGHCYGHIIRIPNFGTIHLAKLHVKHEDFKKGTAIPQKTTVHLTMVDLHLGCAIAGQAKVLPLSTNGQSAP